MTPGILVARKSAATALLIGLCCARVGIASEIDCDSRPLIRIPAGTQILDGSAAGWTHLIFANHCELSSGDVDALPEFTASLTEFLFSVMAARVTRDHGDSHHPYRLEAVAIGVATQIGKKNVLVSSQTQEQLGAKLGPIKRIILDRAEKRLDRIRQTAASDSAMIIDAPTVMLLDDEHQNVILRYFVLVEPESGQLATVVWLIGLGPRGTYHSISRRAVLVKPNLVSTTKLHVDGEKISYGLPGATAFAVTQMPPGRIIAIPEKLRKTALQQQMTSPIVARLESHFRGVVFSPAAR